VALADRVAEWTAEMDVLFAPVGVALAEPAELAELAVEVTTGVVVASAATGYSRGRMLLTSAGIDAYHPGVLPAAREELISAAKADSEAMA
jgi:H2-forming N5,N10-methylenetetrahydromethanopterin dehydrogenase-like enzyme